MTNCKHCNNKIIGLPFVGRYGNSYCEAHRLPESRGLKGIYKPNIGVAYLSNGNVQSKR